MRDGDGNAMSVTVVAACLGNIMLSCILYAHIDCISLGLCLDTIRYDTVQRV